MHIVKEYQLEDNKVLRLILDEDAQSPNKWDDQNVFLVYDHKDFLVKRNGFKPRSIFDYPSEYDNYIIFTVYAYIHSGISLSLNKSIGTAKWDTSSTGFILVKKEEILNDPKCTTKSFIGKKAKQLALELIKTWNQYLSDQVYGYSIVEKIQCPHCNHVEINLGDSAYGFYGNDNPRSNGMLEQIGLKIIE